MIFGVHRGLVFETIASEGAILIMPDDATTEDLLNHKLVQKIHCQERPVLVYLYQRDARTEG